MSSSLSIVDMTRYIQDFFQTKNLIEIKTIIDVYNKSCVFSNVSNNSLNNFKTFLINQEKYNDVCRRNADSVISFLEHGNNRLAITSDDLCAKVSKSKAEHPYHPCTFFDFIASEIPEYRKHIACIANRIATDIECKCYSHIVESVVDKVTEDIRAVVKDAGFVQNDAHTAFHVIVSEAVIVMSEQKAKDAPSGESQSNMYLEISNSSSNTKGTIVSEEDFDGDVASKHGIGRRIEVEYQNRYGEKISAEKFNTVLKYIEDPAGLVKLYFDSTDWLSSKSSDVITTVFKNVHGRPLSVQEFILYYPRFTSSTPNDIKTMCGELKTMRDTQFVRIKEIYTVFSGLNISLDFFHETHIKDVPDTQEHFEKYCDRLIRNIVDDSWPSTKGRYIAVIKAKISGLYADLYASSPKEDLLEYIVGICKINRFNTSSKDLHEVIVSKVKETDGFEALIRDIYNSVLMREPDDEEILTHIADFRYNDNTDETCVDITKQLYNSLEYTNVLADKITDIMYSSDSTLEASEGTAAKPNKSKVYKMLEKVLNDVRSDELKRSDQELRQFLSGR